MAKQGDRVAMRGTVGTIIRVHSDNAGPHVTIDFDDEPSGGVGGRRRDGKWRAMFGNTAEEFDRYLV